MSSAAAANPLFHSVLVLNRSYVAVHVINVRRAFSLLCANWPKSSTSKTANTPTTTSTLGARSANCTARFKRPARRLDSERQLRDPGAAGNSAAGLRSRAEADDCGSTAAIIFARDGNHCQYCGKRFPTSELSLDHIVPTCRGGDTSWENIVCACVRCNVRKGRPHAAGSRHEADQKPVRPKRSPLLAIKLGNPKYESWKTFLDNAYWSVDLK